MKKITARGLFVVFIFCLSSAYVFAQNPESNGNTNTTANQQNLKDELKSLKSFLAKFGSYDNSKSNDLLFRLIPIKFDSCQISFAYSKEKLSSNYNSDPWVKVPNISQPINSNVNRNYFSQNVIPSSPNTFVTVIPTNLSKSKLFFSPNISTVVFLDLSQVDPKTIEINNESKIVLKSLNNKSVSIVETQKNTTALENITVPLFQVDKPKNIEEQSKKIKETFANIVSQCQES